MASECVTPSQWREQERTREVEEMLVRPCAWWDTHERTERETSSERVQQRKPSVHRATCSRDREAQSRCLRFHASLTKLLLKGKRCGPASSERARHDARSDVEGRVEVCLHCAGKTSWAQGAGAAARASAMFKPREGERAKTLRRTEKNTEVAKRKWLTALSSER